MSVILKIKAKDFSNGIVFGEHNEVISVNAVRFTSLSLVEKGFVVHTINGDNVSAARDEQKRYRDSGDTLVINFTKPKKDEFDLFSDEDNCSEKFQPATSLPPLSNEFNNTCAQNSAEVILEAAKKCSGGRCVIIMSEGANPALPIALAAERSHTDVMQIDTVARMKTRQKIEDVGNVLKKSLEKGLWIYMEQATKSITLLRKLAECTAEVMAQGKIHPKSCIFLMCEPHPHFPEFLMKNCVTLHCRLQSDNIADVDVKEDLLESGKRIKLIQGQDTVKAETLGDEMRSYLPYTSQKPEVKATKKKVRISSEVNIVHLEKSTFLEMSASARPTSVSDRISGEGLTRVAKYTLGHNEKFISLCRVGENRYAVGTGSGYVILLDSNGLPLIQFRPHKACMWGISFSSQFDFATACEDGTSIIFNYSLAGQELMAMSVASFQADVFAVTYIDEKDSSSPVLSGGLSATICVLHSDRQNSSFISFGSSIQAMCATQQKQVLVGGGDGLCSLIDPGRCIVRDSTCKHSRKVPAVGCCGDVAITGGFDRTVRVWDIRNGFQIVFKTTIAGVVTAVAINEKYAVACSESNLLVWDVRKMASPLTTKHDAWKDLTRGLVINDDHIVTASVDGAARFWQIN